MTNDATRQTTTPTTPPADKHFSGIDTAGDWDGAHYYGTATLTPRFGSGRILSRSRRRT